MIQDILKDTKDIIVRREQVGDRFWMTNIQIVKGERFPVDLTLNKNTVIVLQFSRTKKVETIPDFGTLTGGHYNTVKVVAVKEQAVYEAQERTLGLFYKKGFEELYQAYLKLNPDMTREGLLNLYDDYNWDLVEWLDLTEENETFALSKEKERMYNNEVVKHNYEVRVYLGGMNDERCKVLNEWLLLSQ